MATAAEKRAQRAANAAAKAAEAEAARAKGEPTEVEQINQAAITHPDQVPSAHGEIERPARSGATVTVACKLGIAYLDLQLCKIEDKFEQNMQGGRTVKEAIRTGHVVRIRGTSYPRGTVPDGFPERPEIVAGAALNRNIDKDWWDEWVRQNRLNPIVVNKMVFAYESDDTVRGVAKELGEIKSGLDPINPRDTKDPRTPKSTRGEISNVETEEARARKAAQHA
mgnify:CR=1 FL=1